VQTRIFVGRCADLVAFLFNKVLSYPLAIYVLAFIPGTGFRQFVKAFESFTKVSCNTSPKLSKCDY
jgi:hypothetical protein